MGNPPALGDQETTMMTADEPVTEEARTDLSDLLKNRMAELGARVRI